jgi:cyanate lyase
MEVEAMCSGGFNSIQCFDNLAFEFWAKVLTNEESQVAVEQAATFHQHAVSCITADTTQLINEFSDMRTPFTHTETYVMLYNYSESLNLHYPHVRLLKLSLYLSELRWWLMSLSSDQGVGAFIKPSDRSFERFWHLLQIWMPELASFVKEKLGITFLVLKSREKHLTWYPVRVTARSTGKSGTFKVRMLDLNQ